MLGTVAIYMNAVIGATTTTVIGISSVHSCP